MLFARDAFREAKAKGDETLNMIKVYKMYKELDPALVENYEEQFRIQRDAYNKMYPKAPKKLKPRTPRAIKEPKIRTTQKAETRAKLKFKRQKYKTLKPCKNFVDMFTEEIEEESPYLEIEDVEEILQLRWDALSKDQQIVYLNDEELQGSYYKSIVEAVGPAVSSSGSSGPGSAAPKQ